MVLFVCGNCGESLKKDQVQKHIFECNGSSFSCIDCRAVFDGKSYEEHTKCISKDHVNYEDKTNKEETIQLLINQSRSESELLTLVSRAILQKELKFATLAKILRQILHDPDRSKVETSKNKNSPPPPSAPPLTASHDSIMRFVFEPLYQHPDVDKRHLANLMVDFFLVLKQRKIQIQNHYLAELLLKIVADAKMWTCLQQLLQYRVIDDSKFLAFELISLSTECSSLYQIALDMLNRRGNTDQIAEVLLGRGHVLDALRFVGTDAECGGICSDNCGGSQRLDKLCLKLLAAAWSSNGDRPLRYTVYSHLNALGRLKAMSEAGDSDLERFTCKFNSLYTSEELQVAEQRFRFARLSSIRGRRRDTQRDDDSFCSTSNGVVDLDESEFLLRNGREEGRANDGEAESGSSVSGAGGDETSISTKTSS